MPFIDSGRFVCGERDAVVARVALLVVRLARALGAVEFGTHDGNSALASGSRTKAGTLSGNFWIAMPLIDSWPVAP